MGLKNYFTLARRSIKEHKRSTATTILGIAFGFVCVIPVFILLFNMQVTINTKLNSSPYVVYGNVSMVDYRDDIEESAKDYILLSGKQHIQEILNEEKISSSIVYEFVSLRDINNSLPVSCYVNGEERVNKQFKSNEYGHISIIDTTKSDNVFPKNLVNHIDGGIFVEGMDNGFTGNGKKQIIVSESFLEFLGLSAQEVYMQDFTMRASQNIKVKDGVNQPIEKKELTAYYFKDYKIVGVIKKQVSMLYDSVERDFMAADIFVLDSNVYDESGYGVLKPKREKSDYFIDLTDFNNKNQEYMFLGFNIDRTTEGRHFSNNGGGKYWTTRVYFESDSFNQLQSAVESLNSTLWSALGKYEDVIRTSDIVSTYSELSKLIDMVCGLLLALGLIMAVCAFINQYATMKFSVDKRKYFLTMMRAIGAEDNSVIKLYSVEAVIIGSIASSIFFVFGFLILLLTKILFANMMNFLVDKGLADLNIGITWSSIFIGLIIGVAILIGITLLLAFLSSYALSKKKITDVLNNE